MQKAVSRRLCIRLVLSMLMDMLVKYPTEEQVRKRAYQIYLERGCQPGHEMDDWLQAQYELMQLPVKKIAELKPPKQTKNRAVQPSLVVLVQSVLLWGAESLTHC